MLLLLWFLLHFASMEVIWWQEAKHTIQWVQTADQQPKLANEQGSHSTTHETSLIDYVCYCHG